MSKRVRKVLATDVPYIRLPATMPCGNWRERRDPSTSTRAIALARRWAIRYADAVEVVARSIATLSADALRAALRKYRSYRATNSENQLLDVDAFLRRQAD